MYFAWAQFKDAAHRNLQRISASLLPSVEAEATGEADALAVLQEALRRRAALSGAARASAQQLREMLPDAPPGVPENSSDQIR